MSRYVDPVLVAVSDCLVLTALERAWARTVPRSDRGAVNTRDRHRGYEIVPIHIDKMDKALAGAWGPCALLATRHDIDVDWQEWANLLDSYTRALIMMQQPHRPQRLAEHLYPLAHSSEADRAYLEVG